MPAAIAIPALIGAAGVGAQVAGAKMASGAAKKAASQQQAAAATAQQFNERVYGDQKQALNPYQMAGQESLARLMAQHWGTPYQAPLPPGAPPAPGPASPPPMPPRAGSPFNPANRPPQAPPMSSLAGMQGQPPPMPPQGGGPPPQTGGGLVQVQAPDGSVRQVPPALAQQLVQRGAKVIS